MTPRALWHCIDCTTHSAGRSRRKRSHGWAWSLVLLVVAIVGCVR